MFVTLSKLDLKDNCPLDDKGAPKLCMKALPGEGAERSCAFDGARVVLMPITDAAHIVHGPIACAGNSWDNRGAKSSGPELFRRGLTTDLTEMDVVYGGEKKLTQAIIEIANKHQPKAIFVYATCVSALIGDDLEAACEKAQPYVSVPVIPVNAPGFMGDKNIGNRISGEVLFQHVIGTAEPEKLHQFAINFIGEYNIAGDLWGIKPSLDALGIHLQACISGDARFDDLRTAHRARLNILVCSKSLTNLAKQMERKWGIPYIEGSFYGIHDTSNTLRAIAGAFDDPALMKRAEAHIYEQEAKIRQIIEPYQKRLAGKKAILFTGGVKTWSMVTTLKELGIEVLAGGTQNSTPEDFLRMKALMDPDAEIIEDTSTAGFLTLIEEKWPDLIIAGGKIKYTAYKTRTPFLDINHGRKLPYAGYQGMVTFAEAVSRTVFSPVWERMRKPFPPVGGEQL
jgi:nitrogenase molybdenum-cofactor synthesis protein NifE